MDLPGGGAKLKLNRQSTRKMATLSLFLGFDIFMEIEDEQNWVNTIFSLWKKPLELKRN
jgi:hypothetical protein